MDELQVTRILAHQIINWIEARIDHVEDFNQNAIYIAQLDVVLQFMQTCVLDAQDVLNPPAVIVDELHDTRLLANHILNEIEVQINHVEAFNQNAVHVAQLDVVLQFMETFALVAQRVLNPQAFQAVPPPDELYARRMLALQILNGIEARIHHVKTFNQNVVHIAQLDVVLDFVEVLGIIAHDLVDPFQAAPQLGEEGIDDNM
ncbi:unnamed protein product [Arabidopsis arenosa]|uniref:Uncharacterized protein n=1 Tax=Arabidopsis arenosa TaxID=38785 RepID=A0A8S2A0A0_ARAAE|nr:unnamed protein product [Arabidopsis arenosa]